MNYYPLGFRSLCFFPVQDIYYFAITFTQSLSLSLFGFCLPFFSSVFLLSFLSSF